MIINIIVKLIWIWNIYFLITGNTDKRAVRTERFQCITNFQSIPIKGLAVTRVAYPVLLAKFLLVIFYSVHRLLIEMKRYIPYTKY